MTDRIETLTVGELRELLNGVPDDVPVLINHPDDEGLTRIGELQHGTVRELPFKNKVVWCIRSHVDTTPAVILVVD